MTAIPLVGDFVVARVGAAVVGDFVVGRGVTEGCELGEDVLGGSTPKP